MASQEHRISFIFSTYFAHALIRVSVCAIQAFMWLYMMSFYTDAAKETRRKRLPYLVASLVILVLSTASALIWTVAAYRIIFEATPGAGNALQAAQIFVNYQEHFFMLSSLLSDCTFRIDDAVLLYRCYILWLETSWVMVLPLCMYFAGLGINLRTYIPLSFSDVNLNVADVFLLVGLNVLLTCIISFRLITSQRKLTSVLPNTSHKVYLGIVGILIESAAPLAAFAIALSVARLYAVKTFHGDEAASILEILFVSAGVLAPQLIIFRVATGTSWADKVDTSTMLSQPIDLATRGGTTSDEESVGDTPAGNYS